MHSRVMSPMMAVTVVVPRPTRSTSPSWLMETTLVSWLVQTISPS